MPYILDIATAVPEYKIDNNQVLNFYSRFLEKSDGGPVKEKISLIIENSKISTRYSCIPDFTGNGCELFSDENYNPSIEKRMVLYSKNVVPLSVKAIDKVFEQTGLSGCDITHIVTVSCTGLLAPGLEFYLSEHYGLQHADKHTINYMGCYAALKAINYANHITRSVTDACVLIVCTELCSLHFNSSIAMEDIVANLIFADGAAAMILCGDKSNIPDHKPALRIDRIGSACIPDTLSLMTWNITPYAFRMHLSRKIANAIRDSIKIETDRFFENDKSEIAHYAIHPGGIRIINAVKEGLHLSDDDIAFSLDILERFGNMSSPTVLFILKSHFDSIKSGKGKGNNSVFACAFGPGLNIEMLYLTPVNIPPPIISSDLTDTYANHNAVV